MPGPYKRGGKRPSNPAAQAFHAANPETVNAGRGTKAVKLRKKSGPKKAAVKSRKSK